MRKPKPIRVSYEINRLAETHLVDAYEKLIPQVKNQVKKPNNPKENNEEIFLQLQGNTK
ncbi:MAG: hypothetical protein K2X39_05000 [Silvanigrellaceae bacterium]|nr:hypothetical protein [Silvanigrellaceae bacterium]